MTVGVACVLLVLHARLEDLAVVLQRLGVFGVNLRSRLDLRVGVAAAEDVGRHCCVWMWMHVGIE